MHSLWVTWKHLKTSENYRCPRQSFPAEESPWYHEIWDDQEMRCPMLSWHVLRSGKRMLCDQIWKLFVSICDNLSQYVPMLPMGPTAKCCEKFQQAEASDHETIEKNGSHNQESILYAFYHIACFCLAMLGLHTNCECARQSEVERCQLLQATWKNNTNYFTSSDPHRGVSRHLSFLITSDIKFGILSGMSSDILSDILSGILSGIASDIQSVIRTFWHSIWHSISFYLAYLLIFYLAYLVAFYGIPAFFLT